MADHLTTLKTLTVRCSSHGADALAEPADRPADDHGDEQLRSGRYHRHAGTTEVMIIAAIALLLFGGKKVPELMRGLGRGISEFKRGAKEVTEPFEEARQDIDQTIGKV